MATTLHITEFSTLQNNPQHIRVLANELLATRIAERIGLPVPVTEVMEDSPWLIENTPDLRIRTGSSTALCQAGLALGVRFVIGPMEGQVYDYIPASVLDRVRNLEAFAGMLAFDKWTWSREPEESRLQRPFSDETT